MSLLLRVKNRMKIEIEIKLRDVFVNGIAASYFCPFVIRKLFYALYGIKTKTKFIHHHCFFEGSNIIIGENSYINTHCFFQNHGGALIEIGENCAVAYGVMFLTTTHEFGSKVRRSGKAIHFPIKVGNGCWIGARATILPGVSIGDGCIIAAGAVVTKECESNGLYGGVPARKIKDLPERFNSEF